MRVPRLVGLLFLLVPVLSGISCASFSGSMTGSTTRGLSAGDRVPGQADAVVPTSQPGVDPGAAVPQTHTLRVRIHVEGVDRSEDVTAILNRLATHGALEDPTAPGLLTITVEELPSTPGGLRFLNLVATAVSGLVIPFYNQVNRSVEFRLYEGASVRCGTIGRTRNHEVIGLVSLPAMPFLWPLAKQSGLYLQSVDDFVHRCLARP